MADSKLQVYSMIRKLTKSSASWANEVQTVLVECIRIAIECDSNIDPCIRVLDAIKGADIKAVVNYLTTHAPVQVINGELKFNKSFKGAFDAEYLNAHPWTEKAIKPKAALQALDVMEAFQAFITRMSKEVTLGQRTVVHADALKELSALSGKLAMRYMPDEEKEAIIQEAETLKREKAEQEAHDAAQREANVALALNQD